MLIAINTYTQDHILEGTTEGLDITVSAIIM